MVFKSTVPAGGIGIAIYVRVPGEPIPTTLGGFRSKLIYTGPGEFWFPALARWLSAPADDEDNDPPSFSRGIGLKPIGSVQGLSIAVLLCSEDMYWWL